MKEIFIRKLRSVSAVAVGLILVLIPFHAFLTVFGNQLVGHYTLLRLWKEVLLALLVVSALVLFCVDASKRRHMLRDKMWWCIAALILLYAVSTAIAYLAGEVTLKAGAYGLLTGTRFLFFFAVTWIIADKASWLWRWRYKLLFGPAAIVMLFGVAQRLFLPFDILRHFGYGPDTIRPYQTIDKKTSYFRIISTLRGANPLGAYTVVILSVLAAKFFTRHRRVIIAGLAVAAVFVLAATYSRSAWIGAFVGVGLIVASKLKHLFNVRRAIILCIAGCIVVATGLIVFRNNDFVQNTFFHTDEHSTASTSSNHDHASASVGALKEILHEPLGRGTGTAGQASVYNTDHPGRIAENYYLQVGQELGWLGLALFVAVSVLVSIRLYAIRQNSLALGLLAAFIGLVIVNMLSHAWADDTLAYVWWGVAGLVLGVHEGQASEKAK